MAGGIFVIQGDGDLMELHEEPYATEKLLQSYLSRYPNILSGDDRGLSSVRRWLLVSEEQAVPDREGGEDRWAVDHLFLDEDAIPTLIEVKRSSDTRIRREVVGQMLDYAANAVVYWPIEGIRAKFEARCARDGRDPSEVLTEVFASDGSEFSEEDFWQRAKTNLQAGRVRLLFVADHIPEELRRIVEFLNSRMDPTEVLALELRQFVGEGVKTLVPRLIGQTAEAEQKKSAGVRALRQWDRDSFLAQLEEKNGPEIRMVAETLMGWAARRMPREYWGAGKEVGSFVPWLDTATTSHSLVVLRTDGTLELRFGELLKRPPYDDERKRQELLDQVNGIPGINLPPGAVNGWKTFSMTPLIDDDTLAQLVRVLDRAVDDLVAAG